MSHLKSTVEESNLYLTTKQIRWERERTPKEKTRPSFGPIRSQTRETRVLKEDSLPREWRFTNWGPKNRGMPKNEDL